LASTQIDSIEDQQARLSKLDHKPKVVNTGTMKQRFQQNRPTLKIGALDHNSELSESEIKSPNLVIQPMAKFSGTKEDHYDAQTPLSYFQESHHKRNDKSMMSNLQGETQHSMRESA